MQRSVVLHVKGLALLDTAHAIAKLVKLTWIKRPRARFVLPLAAAAVATAWAGAHLAWRGGSEAADSRELPVSPADDRGTRVGALSVGDAWIVGRQFRYDVVMESSLRLGGPAMPTTYGFRLAGEWQVTVVERDASRALLHAVFGNPTYEVTTQDKDPDATRRLAEHYRKPIFYEMELAGAQAGRVRGVRVPRHMASAVQTTLKAMGAMLQFVRPDSEPNPGSRPVASSAWEVDEADATGTYVAQYVPLGGDRYRKERGAYTAVLSGQQHREAVKTELAHYRGEFEWTASKGLATADIEEKIEVEAAAAFGNGSSDTKLALTLRDIVNATPALKAMTSVAAGFSAMPAHGGPTREAHRYDKDMAWIAGRDLPFILNRVRQLDGTDASHRRRRGKLYLATAALLRQDAGARALAESRIELGDEASKFLINAMGDAGSPGAQETLSDLLESGRLSDEHRLDALRGITDAGQPTERTLDTLRDHLDDDVISDQAHFGLGTAAHRLRPHDPTTADALCTELTELLEPAVATTDAPTMLCLLKSVGNAGCPGQLALLQSLAVHSDPAVRRAAVDAMRFISDSAVEAIILPVLTDDVSRRVREVAARVLGARRPNEAIYGAFEHALRHDESIRVRTEVLRNLIVSPWVPELIRSLVFWVQMNDQDKGNREMARIWLERNV